MKRSKKLLPTKERICQPRRIEQGKNCGSQFLGVTQNQDVGLSRLFTKPRRSFYKAKEVVQMTECPSHSDGCEFDRFMQGADEATK